MKKDISKERYKELISFCKPLGLKFKDLSLLERAFHHRSFSNEYSQHKNYNNECLEFLGDSVLGLATAAFLYKDFHKNTEKINEGDLAKIKSVVVSEKSLAPIAIKFGVDKMLILGKGEELTGGRQKPAILADCMEAIIGAYYLDSGYDAAEKYILTFIVPAIRDVQKYGGKDFKTLLQEFYQKKYKSCPIYETVEITGPDHEQIFKVVVHLGNVTYGPAEGKSKKDAEQNVAEQAFITLKDS